MRTITRRAAIQSAAMLVTAATATSADVPAALAGSDGSLPDITLLALGERLRGAWGREAALYAANAGVVALDGSDLAKAYSAAHEACASLCDQIIPLPARTQDGLMVKTLAFRWCWYGVAGTDNGIIEMNGQRWRWQIEEPVEFTDRFGEQPSYLRSAASIMADLVRQSVAAGVAPA